MRTGRVRLVGIHTEGTKSQVHCMLGRELLRNTRLPSMVTGVAGRALIYGNRHCCVVRLGRLALIRHSQISSSSALVSGNQGNVFLALFYHHLCGRRGRLPWKAFEKKVASTGEACAVLATEGNRSENSSFDGALTETRSSPPFHPDSPKKRGATASTDCWCNCRRYQIARSFGHSFPHRRPHPTEPTNMRLHFSEKANYPRVVSSLSVFGK